ncbi:MAG: 30S ribosomal protein S6 [Bauldia litoralis]
MPAYESVFIARQDVGSSQVDALTDNFSEIIEQGGGKVSKREYWGLRNLAYRIKKNRKGHYVLLNIEAPAPAVLEMERLMRLNEDILRFMTLRVDELEEGPSVMMQKREERRERRGRDGDGDGRDRERRDDRPRRDDGDAPAAVAKSDTETKTEGDD